MSDKELVDDDYESLCDAEMEVATYKAAVNYRTVKIKCCDNCKNAQHEYEGEVYCGLMDNPRWRVNGVEKIAVCDKYEEQ